MGYCIDISYMNVYEILKWYVYNIYGKKLYIIPVVEAGILLGQISLLLFVSMSIFWLVQIL